MRDPKDECKYQPLDDVGNVAVQPHPLPGIDLAHFAPPFVIDEKRTERSAEDQEQDEGCGE
jgi:hypothetical protein